MLAPPGDDAADDGADMVVPFTPSVTIVRSGSSLAEADPGSAPVSTPLTAAPCSASCTPATCMLRSVGAGC